MAIHKLEHGHTIEFNEEKHVYIHNNEYVVGMSTLLGKLASPMLENWKISQQVNAIKTEIDILAIGIGHDVSRYYNKAIKITDVNELGDVMISQLSSLFDTKKRLH